MRDGQGDEKDGANTEPAGEVASRGRRNFRVTTRKLSVTESLPAGKLHPPQNNEAKYILRDVSLKQFVLDPKDAKRGG